MKNIYHFLYKTTNLINGKYYYGMHSTKKLDDGYLGSGKYLRRSINKYGIENFKIEILDFFENREDLCVAEKKLITETILFDINCMNLKPGGFGGFSKEEQRINAEKSNTKQKILRENDIEWVKRYSQSLSVGQKKAYEEGRRDRVYFFDWNGKKHKEETKIKISEKLSISSKGEGNSQYGTCWITKEGENKKIKKEYLDDYLKDNWIKGRKI